VAGRIDQDAPAVGGGLGDDLLGGVEVVDGQMGGWKSATCWMVSQPSGRS
jgi:hypothetical protein